MAAVPGTTRMGSLHIEAGFVETSNTVGKGSNNKWDQLTFMTPFEEKPAVLASMQTSNNVDLTLGSKPKTVSPWLTAALKDGSTTGVRLSLDRSEVDSGSITSSETVGYIALTAGAGEAGDMTFSVQTAMTGGSRAGWDDVADNKVNTVEFHEPMSNPIAVASKVTRLGGNGGWLRQVKLSEKDILVVVDEDTFADEERNHIDEEIALAAFSKAFTFPNGPSINVAPALAINSKEEMFANGYTWTGCPTNHHGGSSLASGIWCHSEAQMHLKIPLVGSGRCTAAFMNAHQSGVANNFVRLVLNGNVIGESVCTSAGCSSKPVTFDFKLGDSLEFWEGFAIIKVGQNWLQCH